jgi:hypothetical protein
MWHSIQENLKIINSKLSVFDCVSIGLTTLFLLCFSFFLYTEREASKKPVQYLQSAVQSSQVQTSDSRPFGSKTGTTYTFSWCSNSSQIKPENKIYFSDETQAVSSGRTLSKLCQK